MKERKKVLFICVHNSARSQMAEAYLNHYGKENFIAESAGLDAGKEINPVVIEVMNEDSIDISENKTDSVFQFYKEGRTYDFVITVCDKSQGEKCPLFPGRVSELTRLHWGFSDPSSFEGSTEEKKEMTRKVRNDIKKKILEFIDIEKFI